MADTTRIRFGLGIIVLVTVFFALAGAAWAATVESSQPSVSPGERVELSGSGFEPQVAIKLCWDSEGCADLGQTRADDDGSLSSGVVIPEDAAAGYHTINACQMLKRSDDNGRVLLCGVVSILVIDLEPTTTTTTTTESSTTTTLSSTTTNPPASTTTTPLPTTQALSTTTVAGATTGSPATTDTTATVQASTVPLPPPSRPDDLPSGELDAEVLAEGFDSAESGSSPLVDTQAEATSPVADETRLPIAIPLAVAIVGLVVFIVRYIIREVRSGPS